MTKTILMAASALSLLAAPAFAQTGSSQIVVNGTVAGMCGAGNQSGGGTTTGNTPVNLGSLIDSNGQLSVAATTIDFGNMWCNKSANLTVSASVLQGNQPVGPDSGSFVNALDMIVTGAVIDTYMGGGQARTGAPKTAAIGHAFETGTGTYSKATLNVALPAGTSGNDRPVAGDYTGTVTFTASVS